MITKIALKQFDQIWALYDQTWFELKGSNFTVDPFKIYLPNKFVKSLSKKKAEFYTHERLEYWGQIERKNLAKYKFKKHKITKDASINVPIKPNPEVIKARSFISSAFYSICCIATHKVSIEKLIYDAGKKANIKKDFNNSKEAYLKLLGISNMFLQAKWASRIIERAIANEDKKFFALISRRIKEDAIEKRYGEARKWLGTMLLWYLGGNEMKRIHFMTELRKKGLISKNMSELTFNRMLHKLGLINYLHMSKV